MLKKLSINVPLVEALEQMPGYAKLMNDFVMKKRSVTFEDDDRMQHCSAIVQDLLCKRKKIRVLLIFLAQSAYYIL